MSARHRRRPVLLDAITRQIRQQLNRRQFLRGLARLSVGAAGATGLGAMTSACSNSDLPAAAGRSGGEQPQFLHGVASGDPLPNRVVLWTRVTPADAQLGEPLILDYELSTDADFNSVVLSGTAETGTERDYTVKVDPTGLQPYTTYYYRFRCAGVESPIGRTRTVPVAAQADRLRFAAVACSNLSFGYFNGFGAIARRRDLDAVVHLGDYLYETASSSRIDGRDHFPAKEIITLEDYRLRYAQYRSDPDLQEAHRQHPFIAIWDDHETTNNSWKDGAANHTEGDEGEWVVREGQAVRAYFEWMPIRDNPGGFDAPQGGLTPEGSGRIYRTLRYGDLLDLIMLDTRLAGRTEQNGTGIVDPSHTILGEAQRAWFLDQLRSSTAQWKVVGQQMTFAPIKVVPLPEEQGGTYLNEDAWDGYRFDRNAVMNTLADEGLDNVVVLSGDTHVVTAFDLPIEPSDPSRYNPVTGEGSLAVEFSSNGIANVGIIGEFFMANNPHLKYSNLALQGYLLLDVDRQRVQGEYYYTGAPDLRSANETFGAALASASGSNHLQIGQLPTTERDEAPALAP